jgi:hypothetical protein
MIRFNSYLHRDTLYDVIRRWMYNESYNTDAELITQLIHFNNVCISRYLETFSKKIFSSFYPGKIVTRSIQSKSDLKDTLVGNPHYLNPRINQLIEDYHAQPEYFYRETPFQGTLIFSKKESGNTFVGSSRIKRVRRLAEKSARCIIDNMFQAIKHRADILAQERARQMGISFEELITDADDMHQEFCKAEKKLIEDLRKWNPILMDDTLVINDVAGIKIIIEDQQLPEILVLFQQDDDCKLIEIETHKGRYNATNLIVEYALDKKSILEKPLLKKTLNLMKRRGLDPERVSRGFAEFVNSGENSVNIEVIVCNYQEMLESEVGRCMHEDRIIEQRLKQEYRSHLATNVTYLMMYMFNFAVSPQNELGELPFKLWHHYLPDYFDEVMRSLFAIPPLRLVE